MDIYKQIRKCPVCKDFDDTWDFQCFCSNCQEIIYLGDVCPPIENIKCVICGNDNKPLHYNRKCPDCFIPDEDIQILKQLLNGHHLTLLELERGKELIKILNNEINGRVF